MFNWFDDNDNSSLFSMTSGTKIVLGMFGLGTILFGLGYALRPIQEAFDDLHESDESDED